MNGIAQLRVEAKEQFGKEHGLQFLSFRGSVAHGTYIPSDDPSSVDDVDLIGWVTAPLDCYFGLREYGSRGTRELKHGRWDVVLYEARKLVSLLAKGNPNVLCTLFMPSEFVLVHNWAHELLVVNRDLFLTRELYTSFIGYAYSQLKRMEHHASKGYMGAKRKILLEKHGYDTKNASHLIRLLRMGIELLQTGKLNVCRTGLDADELIAIKRGEWTLKRVKKEADRLFEECNMAYERSQLPDSIDKEAINELCIDVLETGIWG